MNKNNMLNQPASWREGVLEQALMHLGQGIILLANDGTVLFTSGVAMHMLDEKDGLVIVQSKLEAVNHQDNKRMQTIFVATLGHELQDKNYKNLYVHRNNQVRPYQLLISNVQLEADIGKTSNYGILIIIKDTHANNLHWLDRLKAKYLLTNREADFAVLLTEGRSIQEIGLVMSIAEDTARQYLKNCFKKMEVQKQHELVCLALDYSRKR